MESDRLETHWHVPENWRELPPGETFNVLVFVDPAKYLNSPHVIGRLRRSSYGVQPVKEGNEIGVHGHQLSFLQAVADTLNKTRAKELHPIRNRLLNQS